MSHESPEVPLSMVVLVVEGQRCGLPLDAVERVLHAVEVTPLPGGPEVLLGIIDLGGRVMPVLSLRRRLGLPDRPIQPGDRLVIVDCGARALALAVDEVPGLETVPTSAVVPTGRIYPGVERFRGVVALEDGLVLIHDLERFLDLDELRALDEALKTREAVHGG